MAYDPDAKAEICDSIISAMEDGKGLATVCRELDFPRVTFLDWVDKDKDLSDKYERARARAADVIFEEILGLQDEQPERVIQLGTEGEGGTSRVDPAWVSWQKNRVDARKWVLAKMVPRKYGDKLEATLQNPDGSAMKSETTVVVDAAVINSALQEKFAKFAPASDG
jgi:hypothetical protein